MKKILYVLSIVIVSSFFCSISVAAEKPTCQELTLMADSLDEVSSAFAEAKTITEGDKVDQSLGELVDSLRLLANVENEAALSNAVNSLLDAYNNMDSEKFGLSLDSVITNLDRLYRRDCQ